MQSRPIQIIAPLLCMLVGGALLVIPPHTATAADDADRHGLPVKKMSNARLSELIQKVAQNVEGKPGYWRFQLEGHTVSVITDERADRMRIIIPITSSEKLDQKQLYRLMQSNFDSALDARYSIAKNIVWSTFIHPLSSLNDREFLSALGQVVNLADTYGGTYSSGALVFRGGDSEGLRRRELIDNLMKKGLSI